MDFTPYFFVLGIGKYIKMSMAKYANNLYSKYNFGFQESFSPKVALKNIIYKYSKKLNDPKILALFINTAVAKNTLIYF